MIELSLTKLAMDNSVAIFLKLDKNNDEIFLANLARAFFVAISFRYQMTKRTSPLESSRKI